MGNSSFARMLAGCLVAWASAAVASPIEAVDAGLASGTTRTGTAFAVAPQIVVTNHHVVRACPELRVLRDGHSHLAQVIASDPASDLAAVVVDGASLPPLPLADASQELGDPVAVLGFPLTGVLGDGLRVTTGIVSGLSGMAGDTAKVQISAPVNAGNSGGPVLDDSGAVAGVVIGKLDTRSGVENISFAIRTESLRRFLARHRLPVKDGARHRAPPGRTLSQRIRGAAPSIVMVRCSQAGAAHAGGIGTPAILSGD